ncbi:MAG: succinate dehydrogenase, hydrophobic membrane anchor protein [Pseudomonadota bacterium]
MRTSLKQVRGLGAAKDGTEHFWRQRMTALANVPLLLAFVWIVISLAGSTYAEALATLSHPVTGVIMALVIVSAFIHMKLGMQVIIEDYVHGEGMKVALLMLNTFFCVVVGLASLFAVLKLSFGA